MAASVVGRQAESRLIADFLQSATLAPAGLVIEGEPGIGKTTLWQAAVDLARERGFQVLSTRPAAAESVLAYAALTDMVGVIDGAMWAELPNPQRFAINRALSGAGAADSVADPRGVTAGFLSLVMHMQEAAPVLLAIDDLQWLDSSSMRVVAFAARRLAGRVGIIGTVRMEPDSGDAAAWVQLPRFMELRRIRLGPLSMGGLRQVVSERLGQALPRSRAVRIHEVSHGNPFYALELAKVMDTPMPKAEARLPGSLVELVRARIGSLEAATQNVLLAAACAYAPTVDLVARATGNGYERVLGLLSVPEDNGIVRIDGHRLSFTHPLLARGVYSEASSAARRKMHRILAGIVEEPELQARHLAMAVTKADPHTVGRLDDAAEMARARGAPAAAAELLDLALGLGGDTAERRIRLAGNHFEAGDSERARGLLEQVVTDQEPGPLRAVALSLLGSVRAFDDSFTDGVELWKRSAAEAGDNLALRVPTLVILALTQFSTGRIAEGVPTADQAVADAGRLGDPLLLSQALGVRVLIHFLRGEGIDEADLQRALELEKRGSSVASAPGLQMVLRPSLQHGLLLGWTGEFERAHRELLAVRQLCAEHGHEFELMYVAYYSAQIAIWWGDLTEAAAIAEDAMNRAEQTGGDIVTGAALTIRAALATHAGSEEQARRDAEAAITMHQRCGARMLAEWPIALLGFLEVSLGHYEAALTALQPLLSRYAEGQFGMEIHVAGFVPDAVEALVHVGRLDEAEPLVDELERNGRRLDRAWMLAVGGRCRAMIHGARGDLDAAVLAAQEAMRQHERISMPFDLARTQLVLGQLEQRRRHRETATAALRGALDIFERLGTPLWAARASAELARTGVAAAEGASELTVGEQRVAELAATGMKNRDVAAALFISPKTVEANLARIYRKLGIHSRAELGRLIAVQDHWGNT